MIEKLPQVYEGFVIWGFDRGITAGALGVTKQQPKRKSYSAVFNWIDFNCNFAR